MSEIYVSFSGLDQISSRCKTISSSIRTIQSDLQETVRQLDWDVKYEDNINNTAILIAEKLRQYSAILENYQNVIGDARNKYLQTEKKLGADSYDPLNAPGSGSSADGGAASAASAGAEAGWLGYEFSDDHPGVTAWIGKASAHAQNEWGHAGVDAYLGKAEANAEADFNFMETTTKKEYVDGEWVEKTSTEFISAGASAGVGISVAAAEATAGIGNDLLGLEGKAEGSAGNASAEIGGEFSVSDDGVNANLKGEAMVSAVEGEASGTINILGFEITGKVGGYAGAVGVEGKVGIEDNKFVIEGGVAALIGGSAGIEIGFNDEGWNNFIDFITFWD